MTVMTSLRRSAAAALGVTLALPLTAALTASAAAAPAAPVSAAASYEAITAWGSEPEVPWVIDGELRDGPQRVALGLESVYALERTLDGWLVTGDDGSGYQAFLVRPDGSKTALGRRMSDIAVAEGDRRVVQVRGYSELQRVTVHRAADGEQIASRRFRYPRVLAMRGSKVLMSVTGGRDRRTFWWDISSDRTRRVVSRPGISADLSAGRLVLADPRGGPCNQSLVRLHHPKRVLKQMRTLTVTGWNATDDTMLLGECYYDEPYQRSVVIRRDPDQRTLAHMSTNPRRGDKFGPAVWESSKTWLHVRYDDARAFIERCNKRTTRCERAIPAQESVVDPIDGSLTKPQIVLGTLF